MPKNTGTLIGAPLKQADSQDQYPVMNSGDIKGGRHTVATTADRDTIPAYLREAGMFAYVIADGQLYQLQNDLITWLAFILSGVTLPPPVDNVSGFNGANAPVQIQVIGNSGNVDLQLQIPIGSGRVGNVDPTFSAYQVNVAYGMGTTQIDVNGASQSAQNGNGTALFFNVTVPIEINIS